LRGMGEHVLNLQLNQMCNYLYKKVNGVNMCVFCAFYCFLV